MAANPHRGETALTLDGTLYTLRPSFAALVAAEEEIGSLIAMVDRAGAGAVTVKDITVLLHCCAQAGGHDVPREEFASALLREGISATVLPLRTILSGVMGQKE